MTEDMLAISIPIVFAIILGLVLWAHFHFRYKTQAKAQETIRAALEKGHELTPELLERIAGPKPDGDRDLRRGFIAIALGIAFALLGFMVDEEDAIKPLIGVGMFPFLIGVAYLAMWRFGKHPD